MIDIDQLSKDVTSLYEQAKRVTSDQNYMTSATQYVLSAEKHIKTELMLFLLNDTIVHTYDTKLRCLQNTIKNIETQGPINLDLSPIERIIQFSTNNIDAFFNSAQYQHQKAKEEDTQKLILDVLSDHQILDTRATLKQLIEMDEKCVRDLATWAKSQYPPSPPGVSAPFYKNSIFESLRTCLEVFWMGVLQEGDEYNEARAKFKKECFKWINVVRWSEKKGTPEEQQEFLNKINTSWDKIFVSEDLLQGYFSNVREVNVQDVLQRRAQTKELKSGLTL